MLPDDLNAFSVMEILLRARRSQQLTSDQPSDIDRSIADIEASFFSADRPSGPPPDLAAIARRWVAV